jgi:hypothetical protein
MAAVSFPFFVLGVGKNRRERRNMRDAVQKIPGKVKELLDLHALDLEQAWANVGDEGLTISLSAKIGFDKARKGICDVTLSFTKEKVKDTASFAWDDFQLNLLKVAK